MIHTKRLNELLTPMLTKNVDITLQCDFGVLVAVSTSNFDYGLDDVNLTLDNNSSDCEYLFEIPLIIIESVDESEYQDFGTIVINLKNKSQLFITKC